MTNDTINLLNLLYPHKNVTCLHVDAVVFRLRNGRKSHKNSFVDTPFLQDGEETKCTGASKQYPEGCHFSEKWRKLLPDFGPPCNVTGNMTLRDSNPGTAPIPPPWPRHAPFHTCPPPDPTYP